MNAVLLIDFGSTFTKITAVDTEEAVILGTAASYTTVQTDINEGLGKALAELETKVGKLSYSETLACSSAAGGLRLAASGLVPSLTAEAARVACLGAGGKVVKSYSYQLTREDVEEIAEIAPDIFLLTGGTDGGNADTIVFNAKMLADCSIRFPVLIAGNRSCAAECEAILSDWETHRCENVMPQLNKLNTEPVQEQIRELFLKRIIKAKGLSEVQGLVDDILMPTPAAMLAAMELLAEGTGQTPGLGELIAVDLGGATTDVYSIAAGTPSNDNTIIKGLPEPYAKRTVEGDIGMRYSVWGILEEAGIHKVSELAGLTPDRIQDLAVYVTENTSVIPETQELIQFDRALACLAVEIASRRHAGTIEEVYTPMGPAYGQTGKDLTRVSRIVLTGGAIVHNPYAQDVGSYAQYQLNNPCSLRPKRADIYVDKNYILAAMGLLAGRYPEQALNIMKKELLRYGTCE